MNSNIYIYGWHHIQFVIGLFRLEKQILENLIVTWLVFLWYKADVTNTLLRS